MSNFPNAILSGFWIRTMCNIAYLVLGLNNLRRLSVKFRYDRAKLFGFSGMATMTQPYFCFFSLFMFNPLLILTSLLQSCVSSGTSEIVGPRKPYTMLKRENAIRPGCFWGQTLWCSLSKKPNIHHKSNCEWRGFRLRTFRQQICLCRTC